jgi:hypothetical protein
VRTAGARVVAVTPLGASSSGDTGATHAENGERNGKEAMKIFCSIPETATAMMNDDDDEDADDDVSAASLLPPTKRAKRSQEQANRTRYSSEKGADIIEFIREVRLFMCVFLPPKMQRVICCCCCAPQWWNQLVGHHCFCFLLQ